MITKEIVINGENGFDAKPATLFIQKASRFKSSIWVEKGERKANGKSLLGLMSLGLANGQRIKVIADGEDEEQAIAELYHYLLSGSEGK
jgi:phosphotransferase system HPr (HPr) family protein